MSDPVTARAQTEQTDIALEEAAKALKRQQAANRKALQAIRQAQAERLGISVVFTHTGSIERDVHSAPGKNEVSSS
jgi:hypothetical protein